MKVTADMLTEKSGFFDGVVCECKHGNTTIISMPISDMTKYADELLLYDSIKILNGPMSIWNHAPEQANYVTKTVYGDFIFSENIYEKESIARPWWAKE